ncbi:MAG: ABC transporter ATP-binding protein [Leptolinea sp.]|nr:ABC transporter ATP-binding protein [Leptolinea sp.]
MKINNTTSSFDLKKAVSNNRLQGLWRLMTGYRLTYLIATLGQGFAALAKTATYFLLRYFVDTYLSGSSPVALPVLAAGFLGLAALEGGFTFLSGSFAARTAEGITRRLRNYLFDHIQHLTFTYHDSMQTGELIQRSTSDVDALRRFFADQAISVGRIILLFVVNFIALLNLNASLAWKSVIVIPIIVVISIIFFQFISKAYEAYQEQEAVLSTTLQENLTGVRVVKAFARQDFEKQKFETHNLEKFIRGKRLLLLNSYFWPVTDVICTAQILFGYYTGATMTINGEISLGTYLAYCGLIVWIIFPMRNLGRLIVQMSTGLVSYGRVMEIIKQEREPLDDGIVPVETSAHGDLQFEDVGFVYSDGTAALENISLNVKSGQVIALLGSTGSGKTTLVNLLPRFYEYTGGHIYLDRQELNTLSRRWLRSQIGIVEQEPFLFSRSIEENICYGVDRSITQDEIEAAARAAAIHDVILTFPEGYKTIVGEKGVTLSGGQKQRIAIARTLLKNPRILILDDSTSSVDTETEVEIRTALQALMKNRTTFIIAHRIQSIQSADLILVMDRGRIIQRGKHTGLLRQPGMYRQIFDIQTRIEEELQSEIASVRD